MDVIDVLVFFGVSALTTIIFLLTFPFETPDVYDTGHTGHTGATQWQYSEK